MRFWLASLVILFCGAAAAENLVITNLNQALSSAYKTNPGIRQSIAQLESVNEQLSQAQSGFLPDISGQVDYGRQRNAFGSGDFDYAKFEDKSLALSQPLFKGGENFAKLETAEQAIGAARERLRETEQQVLLSAVVAYMDLITDVSLLEQNTNNEKVLEKQLELTEARFEYGELSRTDVAQAKARFSLATADKLTAESNLESSRAEFERVIGLMPGKLLKPLALPPLPDSLDDALLLAKYRNPSVLAARFEEKQAESQIDENIAQLLPELSIEGSMSRSESSSFDSDSIGLRLRVPIFTQGGVDYSRVRQAKKSASAARYLAIDTENRAVEDVKSAWKRLKSARTSILANEAAVKAAEIALEGVKAEEGLGTRTILDVLDAEQELHNTRSSLVRAEREQTVAHYEILAEIGRLTPKTLEIDAEIYDAEQNLDKVKYKFIGY